jgi:hypothetical protein
VQIHLRTRGTPRGLENAFLNSGPDSRWWDAYADWTATERPCLLAVAENGGEHWRVLLSGIPSVRTDSGGRLIYYTLVLEGTYDTAEEGREAVLSLASHLLADLDADELGRGRLSDILDGLCPAAEVDRLLAAPTKFTADREELTARLVAAVTSLERVPYETPTEHGRADRWIAGRAAPGASAAFLTRLSALLAGKERGQAHLLNLVSEAEDVAELFPGPLAVLVEGGTVGNPALPLKALPVVKTPSEPPVPPGSHPKVWWRTPMALASLTALVLLLVLAGGLWIWGVIF